MTEDNTATMTYDEWAAFGLKQGWAGPAVCSTHDGIPTTAEEDDMFDEGDEPCVHVLRLYEDVQVRDAVEANHSPSVWRKTTG